MIFKDVSVYILTCGAIWELMFVSVVITMCTKHIITFLTIMYVLYESLHV